MLELVSHSAENLQRYGEILGQALPGGTVIVLTGGLGAGKTTLTQGIARGLNISSPVTSPTFSLIHVHEGVHKTLVHCDFYRLKSVREAENIGFFDYLTKSNVVLVEWGEDYTELYPKEYIHILIEASPEGRLIKATAPEGIYRNLIEQWVETCQSSV